MSQIWKDYQEQHKERFLNEMMDLLRIPSISARSEHKEDMYKCAEAVKASLLAAGCGKAEAPKVDPATERQQALERSKEGAFGTQVKVTNPRNGRSVVLTVNDRGPFVGSRIADLSQAAAAYLGILRRGIAHLRLEVVPDSD